MNNGDLIRDSSGYQYCVKRYVVINRLPIAVLECPDSQQPFALVVGIRTLPNGKCVWDRATWFSNFASAMYEYDVEKVKRKNERYA